MPIPINMTAAGARGEDGLSMDVDLARFNIHKSDDVIAIQVFKNAGGTTGVDESYRHDIQENEQDVYYNLNGQRVENPGRGLYIKNGRKVLIK